MVGDPDRGCVVGMAAETAERTAARMPTGDVYLALAQSQAQMSAILDSIADGVVIADVEGNLLYWNRAAVEMHDLPSEEPGLLRWAELPKVYELSTASEGILPVEKWPVARILKGETLRDWEVTVRRIDRDWTRVFLYGGTLVRDTDGIPTMAVITVVDDTLRVLSETALRKSEEDLRQARRLLEAATAGTKVLIATVDRDFRYTFFNRQHHEELLRLTGKETKIGMSLSEVLADLPEERDRALAVWRRALAGETVVQTLAFGDPGRYRQWYSTRHTPIRDAGGEIVGAGEVTSDITPLMAAEEALRENEQRFHLALRNAPVAVAVQDRHLRFLWAYNQRSVSLDAMIGKTDEEVWGSDEGARVMALKRRVLDEGVELREHMWIQGPKGRFFVDIYCEPKRDDAGNVIGVGTATVDRTAAKLAEEALTQAAADLAAANTELLASRAATERASIALAGSLAERTRQLREKEVLLKEVHHRVKNNLQVISSLVSLEGTRASDPAVKNVLGDVVDRVRSMALVHEKLYKSDDLGHIDFAEYSRGLLSYLWRAQGCAAEGVRLVLDLSLVKLPVNIAVPCGLILNELASNALKHAFPTRPRAAEIAVELRETAGGRVQLSVRDNGVGLPHELDWRAASSLGLRLVQMLAVQLSAEMDIKSEAGTTVELSFSVAEDLGKGAS